MIDGKLADITGPGITDRWGVTSTDLGASVLAPNDRLVSVFGDTFSGNRVGHGDWRSQRCGQPSARTKPAVRRLRSSAGNRR